MRFQNGFDKVVIEVRVNFGLKANRTRAERSFDFEVQTKLHCTGTIVQLVTDFVCGGFVFYALRC